MGVVLACDLVFAVFGYAVTPARAEEVATFGALVLCAATCVEAMRRLGTPSGLARDLLGAWWLPAILLLPPMYSLFMPIPVYLHLQYRIRRTVVHRRVLNAASVALAGFVSSWAFHALLGPAPVQAVSMSVQTAEKTLLTPLGLFWGVLCCALFTVLNTAVVAIAVRLSAPETPWRRLLWDREALVIDSAEVCVGMTVAILAGVSVPLLVIALPPVTLLQRSLLYEQLQVAARTDPKTGLLNAATWEREAGAHLTRALHGRRSVTLLLIDIDHFKQVNDTHGHMFGDHVLLGVARTLTHHLRPSDLLGRFGGEEFVVLLPGADMAEGCRVAERLRSRVERTELVAGGKSVTITVSIGVALFQAHGDDVIELLASADHGLYRAKDAGRNRVCMPPTGPWAVSGGLGANRAAPARER
ncbi:diguanylate cyclase (GGDEF)-like protein [Lipingzhangella halophila]|uniref:Diguanylate cyclase (GGDEF)-like protein n=1 Tax=Lipingzhangella halophila TaxID=1783352 RepID=A0A7W7RJQ0_9ACTN|nr:GGDEF domain-containing protein [Lipingzhangella halophila]MBB4933258.1 diguanylate cyclase (GGDEF)-like protein [Lipingzhangella halophila]